MDKNVRFIHKDGRVIPIRDSKGAPPKKAGSGFKKPAAKAKPAEKSSAVDRFHAASEGGGKVGAVFGGIAAGVAGFALAKALGGKHFQAAGMVASSALTGMLGGAFIGGAAAGLGNAAFGSRKPIKKDAKWEKRKAARHAAAAYMLGQASGD